MTRRKIDGARALLVVSLLLVVYVAIRLHNLASLPLFVDEGYHLATAERFWDGELLIGARDGRLLHVWFNAFLGPEPPAAGWPQRAGSVLVGLLGLSAFYALVRDFVSRRGGMLAIGLWIMTPYLVFFERMALSDSLLSPLTAVAVWVAWRLYRRRTWYWAAVLGGMLVVLMGAKLAGVVWIPLPLATILLIPGITLRRRFVLGAGAYGTLAALWGPFTLVLRWKGYDYMGVATVQTSGPDQGLFQRIMDNLTQLWHIDVAYLSVFVLILSGVGWLVWFRHAARPAIFGLMLLGMSAGGAVVSLDNLNSRYALNHVVWVLLPLAAGVGLLIEHKPRWRPVIYGLIVVWGVLFYGPFQLDMWNDPGELNLNRDDRHAYVQGESAGFGNREVGQYLQSKNDGLPVLGVVANCQPLRHAAYPHRVLCPRIRWDGSSQEEIIRLVEQWAARGAVYVVEEELPYVNLAELSQPRTTLITVERPGGGSAVTLYQIEP